MEILDETNAAADVNVPFRDVTIITVYYRFILPGYYLLYCGYMQIMYDAPRGRCYIIPMPTMCNAYNLYKCNTYNETRTRTFIFK